ncbi:MAG TPA: hypothetical protein VGR53_10005 [Nitrososphaerales archaeon]|nr:hypothetical protein [Nitrososphaerales archaeon]
MKIDPLLDTLLREASEKNGISYELLYNIIVEEKLQRYRREGDKRIMIERITELLEESSR